MFGESFRTLEIGRKSEYNRILKSVLEGAGISVELPLLRSILRAIPHPKIREMFHDPPYSDPTLKPPYETAASSTPKQTSSQL